MLAAAGFWYITENDRADRAENYRRQQEQQAKEEALEREREERQLEKVDIDQNSMSEELQAIERANAVRVASAEKRKEQQRDKIERVLALLRSPTLNRLARTYCGEDLSALRSRFEGEVQNGVTKVPRTFKFFGTSRANDNKAHVNDIIERARKQRARMVRLRAPVREMLWMRLFVTTAFCIIAAL